MEKRVAALDGWRGIAILMVLFDHLQDSLAHRYLWFWSTTGWRGVNLFFVLSGFLITSGLLKSPDLGNFYARRFFRLMPVAWTFLAIMLLLGATSFKEVALCLLFIRNFWGHLGAAGHFWSLSIEEQFYLIWPTVLRYSGSRVRLWIVAGGALASGYLHWAALKPGHFVQGTPTWFYADGLLIGCLFAMIFADDAMRSRLALFSRFGIAPALLGYLCCVSFAPRGSASLVENLLIGFLIFSTALYPASRAARGLAFPPLAWLGRISYSLYVWQEPFMAMRSALMFCTAMPAVVLASYYGLERPINRFGRGLLDKQSRRVVLLPAESVRPTN